MLLLHRASANLWRRYVHYLFLNLSLLCSRDYCWDSIPPSQVTRLGRVTFNILIPNLHKLIHPADLLRRHRQTRHSRPNVPPLHRPISHGPLHPRRLEPSNLGLQPRRRSPILHLLPPYLPEIRLHPPAHNLGLCGPGRASGLANAHRSCGGTSGVFSGCGGKRQRNHNFYLTRLIDCFNRATTSPGASPSSPASSGASTNSNQAPSTPAPSQPPSPGPPSSSSFSASSSPCSPSADPTPPVSRHPPQNPR